MVRKTETLQSLVQSHHSDLAERASDALGNIALVQSFARVETEVTALKSVSDRLLAAQFPVLSWWAIVAVATRAATTLTVLAIILLGTWLFQHGTVTIGEIVTFMALAGMVIARLDQAVNFANRMAMDAARLYEFFEILDTMPALHDRPDAVDPERFRGRVDFENVSFGYDGTRPAVSDLTFTALPGETVALVGATGAGKSTALMLLHRAFDPQSGRILIDGNDIRDVRLAALRRNIGVVFRKHCCSTVQSLKTCASESPKRRTRNCATRPRAPRRSISSTTIPTASTPRSASADVRSPVANASVCRSRVPCLRTRQSSFSTKRPARLTPRPIPRAGGSRRGDEKSNHICDRASPCDNPQGDTNPGL